MDRIIVVTTERSADSEMLARAAKWSSELACPLETDREKFWKSQGINEEKSGLLAIVVGKEQTRVVVDGQQYYFHPNIAKLRLQNLLRGEPDRFVQVTGLHQGSSLLDCTLGLGADAIVASHIAGSQGVVVGLECQPVLALLLREGLSGYTGIKGNRHNPVLQNSLVEAMRRITVRSADSLAYLADLEDNSFDIVYFDPMFRQTKKESSSMDILRTLGSDQPVTTRLLEQALRVASQRVVLKERQGSPVFRELGIEIVSGGKYSPVAYGILEK